MALSRPAAGALAPYFPTPCEVAVEMLRLGRLEAGERLLDLGSGDGRIVLLAAERFGAQASGVELDPLLWRRSVAEIGRRGVAARASIRHGDLLGADCSAADLVTLYLMPAAMPRVAALLARSLAPGARIVAHDFPLPAWATAAFREFDETASGRRHRLFLHVAPRAAP